MSEWSPEFRKKTARVFVLDFSKSAGVSLGHSQQLVARALGHRTWASLCVGGIPKLSILDYDALLKRAEELGMGEQAREKAVGYIKRNLPDFIAEVEGMHGGQGA
jgi:hypothetical protein